MRSNGSVQSYSTLVACNSVRDCLRKILLATLAGCNLGHPKAILHGIAQATLFYYRVIGHVVPVLCSIKENRNIKDAPKLLPCGCWRHRKGKFIASAFFLRATGRVLDPEHAPTSRSISNSLPKLPVLRWSIQDLVFGLARIDASPAACKVYSLKQLLFNSCQGRRYAINEQRME
jgi:hypothetical protein